jgi:hypothetical protein
LILGGGTATALALDRRLREDAAASVLLVDRANAQLFVPLSLGNVTRVFRTPADAMELRNRIIDALEGAHQTTDQAARRACLTLISGRRNGNGRTAAPRLQRD